MQCLLVRLHRFANLLRLLREHVFQFRLDVVKRLIAHEVFHRLGHRLDLLVELLLLRRQFIECFLQRCPLLFALRGGELLLERFALRAKLLLLLRELVQFAEQLRILRLDVADVRLLAEERVVFLHRDHGERHRLAPREVRLGRVVDRFREDRDAVDGRDST